MEDSVVIYVNFNESRPVFPDRPVGDRTLYNNYMKLNPPYLKDEVFVDFSPNKTD
jgi:hypothetical protein